jgi:hypothetical protein
MFLKNPCILLALACSFLCISLSWKNSTTSRAQSCCCCYCSLLLALPPKLPALGFDAVVG